MPFGIYKPGQGYWVRVLSAVGGGLAVLVTAAWLWQETAAVDLPTSAWNVALTNAQGAPTVGDTLTASATDEVTGELVEIGQITVQAFQASDFRPIVTLHNPALSEGREPLDIDVLDGASFSGEVEGGGAITPIPVIDRLYVQGAVAGVVMLIGAMIVFWLIGSKPSSCEFLIATDGEMKKVNWSTRREVFGSTWVVIVASVMVATALFGVDYVFRAFFTLIEVLQK